MTKPKRSIYVHSVVQWLDDIKMNSDIEIEFYEGGVSRQIRLYNTVQHAVLIGVRVGQWMRGENVE